MRGQDQQSRVFYELCALILNILRSPPMRIPFSSPSPPMAPSVQRLPPSRRMTSAQFSPAGFVSLLLGIFLALILCGSLTFVIGFILMPWVLGLVMVFYLVGFVSNLSELGRAVLYPTATSASPRKKMSDWSFL